MAAKFMYLYLRLVRYILYIYEERLQVKAN